MMKLSESQLRKLIREMSGGDQLPEYLMFMGLDDEGLDTVFSALSGGGPVDALSEIQGQLGRLLTSDEVKGLIDLFIKEGWFHP